VGSGLLTDLREAVLAVGLLGVTVASLYWLIVGDLLWTFVVGEVFGLMLGVGLLVAAGPRRRRP
jgi:hypothetical protein